MNGKLKSKWLKLKYILFLSLWCRIFECLIVFIHIPGQNIFSKYLTLPIVYNHVEVKRQHVQKNSSQNTWFLVKLSTLWKHVWVHMVKKNQLQYHVSNRLQFSVTQSLGTISDISNIWEIQGVMLTIYLASLSSYHSSLIQSIMHMYKCHTLSDDQLCARYSNCSISMYVSLQKKKAIFFFQPTVVKRP